MKSYPMTWKDRLILAAMILASMGVVAFGVYSIYLEIAWRRAIINMGEKR